MTYKTYYYAEITIPGLDADIDIIGAQREFLEQHIETTNSKMSKIAKETIFNEVKPHNRNGDTQAITLEFLNKRSYDTYMTVIAEFRTWVAATHNVEYSHEVTLAYPHDLAVRMLDGAPTEGMSVLRYNDKAREYMIDTLPTERGFK